MEDSYDPFNSKVSKSAPSMYGSVVSAIGAAVDVHDVSLGYQQQETVAASENHSLLRSNASPEQTIVIGAGLADAASRANNWPSCYPIIFHNIKTDIPSEEKRSLVRKAYFLWLTILPILFYNILTTTFLWGSSRIADSQKAPHEFGLAVGYFFLVPLGSWFMWYRPFYNGCRSSSPSDFKIVKLCFFAYLVYALVLTIGVPEAGMMGFVAMARYFQDGSGLLGFASLINFSICLVQLMYGSWVLLSIMRWTKRSIRLQADPISQQ